jgi:hypothetical protein
MYVQMNVFKAMKRLYVLVILYKVINQVGKREIPQNRNLRSMCAFLGMRITSILGAPPICVRVIHEILLPGLYVMLLISRDSASVSVQEGLKTSGIPPPEGVNH